jgi:hypothetical protein
LRKNFYLFSKEFKTIEKLNSSEISKKKSYFTLLQRKKKRVLIALIDRENKNTITHLQGYMA